MRRRHFLAALLPLRAARSFVPTALRIALPAGSRYVLRNGPINMAGSVTRIRLQLRWGRVGV